MFKYFMFPYDDFSDLSIYQYGKRVCEPGHSVGPSVHTFYLFHYILSGSGTYTSISDTNTVQTFSLAAGQGFMIFPGRRNQYVSSQDDPWSYAWVEFDGLIASDLVAQAGFHIHQPVYLSNNDELRSRMTTALQYLLDNPKSPKLELMGNFYLFMNCLVQSSANKVTETGDSVQDFHVQKAIAYIKRNSFHDISVQDIADFLHINRSYLSRVFGAVLGMSPSEFLLRHRINRSRELLIESSHSIGKVSEMAGFKNQMYFARAFKRETGQTPLEYRKSRKLIDLRNKESD